MTILETLLLALSLCADCFAVSLCSSVTLKNAGWRDVLLTALAFAVIQSALLLAGCLLGDLFYGLVETVSGIIGFVLLAYVGGSMLVEGIRGCGEGKNLNGWKNILLGGVATSIDAAAVGVSQSMSGSGLSGTLLLLADLGRQGDRQHQRPQRGPYRRTGRRSGAGGHRLFHSVLRPPFLDFSGNFLSLRAGFALFRQVCMV